MAESNKKGQGTQQGTQGKSGESTAGTGVTQMAKEAAGSMSQTAGHYASAAAEQAEHATHGVGSGMRSLAGSLREHSPSEGMMHTAAGKVADTLERGGRYLEQESLGDMAEDVAGMVRRNPIACVVVCLGVGFFLGRLMTSSTRSY